MGGLNLKWGVGELGGHEFLNIFSFICFYVSSFSS